MYTRSPVNVSDLHASFDSSSGIQIWKKFREIFVRDCCIVLLIFKNFSFFQLLFQNENSLVSTF